MATSPPISQQPLAQHKTARFPVVTMTLLAVILAVAVFPPLRSILVYDRAAILRGEVLRLITGNLVHLSASHLHYDMLALGMAGCLIEYRGYRHFGWLCGFAAVAIGGALFVFQPDTRFYGGASGIATAAVVSLALHGLSEDGLWRRICTLALAVIVVKIIAEFATGQSLFLGSAGGELVNCPLSHLTGAVVAVLGCGKGSRAASIGHRFSHYVSPRFIVFGAQQTNVEVARAISFDRIDFRRRRHATHGFSFLGPADFG